MQAQLNHFDTITIQPVIFSALELWLTCAQNTTVNLWSLLTMGLLPFIGGDLLKIIVATVIVKTWVLKNAKQ